MDDPFVNMIPLGVVSVARVFAPVVELGDIAFFQLKPPLLYNAGSSSMIVSRTERSIMILWNMRDRVDGIGVRAEDCPKPRVENFVVSLRPKFTLVARSLLDAVFGCQRSPLFSISGQDVTYRVGSERCCFFFLLLLYFGLVFVPIH